MKQTRFLRGVLATAIALTMGTATLAQDAGIDNQTRNVYMNALKGKRVVYIPMSMQLDLTQAWAKAMQRQAKELGYTIDIRDANWNTEAGSRALTTAIAEKPDLIVLQNANLQSYARLIKQATEAKIKILQLNMESLQKSDGYVGADWVGIGQLAGQEVAARCAAGKGRSTKVQVVIGASTAPADLYQMFGFRQALAKHPEIKIVSQQAANYDPSKARAITASVLQQHPDLCASFGIWDGQDTGAGAAVKEAGQQGKVFVITSGGGHETTCQRVKDGTFSTVIAFDVRAQAVAINTQVASLLQSKQPASADPIVYYTPNHLITKSNLRTGSCWSMDDVL
jgi:ribose transport system substrate-binding protein